MLPVSLPTTLLCVALVAIVSYVTYTKLKSYSDDQLAAVNKRIDASAMLDAAQINKLGQLVQTIQQTPLPTPVTPDNTPVGTIFTYTGTSSPNPAKYAMCDGSVYSISQFPELFTVIGSTFNNSATNTDPSIYFNVPDMRSLFVRGLDVRTTRTMGSIENYSTAMPTRTPFALSTDGAHAHTTTIQVARCPTDNTSPLTLSVAGTTDIKTYTSSTAGAHTHTMSGGDAETRPRNIALNYIIRIK